jgi:hypothetical protein
VLANFGIARALGSAASESITDAGIVLGTPEYMSPEQAVREAMLLSAEGPYNRTTLAYVLARSGQRAAAEQSHRERRGWLAYLRVNPIMDGLRGRARFEALVRQMKL